MPRPLKPPKGLFVSTQVIFHPQLKAQVRDTLIQLMALAWNNAAHQTPFLTYSMLEELTGKRIKTLYGHLAVLRDDHAALRLQHAGDGTFHITFASWLFEAQTGVSVPHNNAAGRSAHAPLRDAGCSKISEMPVKEEEDINPINSFKKEIPHLNDHPRPLAKKTSKKPTVPGHKSLSAGLRRALNDAGVFNALLAEIAASGCSEKQLLALLAWAQQDSPARAAPLFIWRLRNSEQPPPQFFETPCAVCGLRGSHAADCRMRYLDGLKFLEDDADDEDGD